MIRAKLSLPIYAFLALCICLLATVLTAPAQTPPSLAFKLSSLHPSLTLKGDIGTIYSIQYTDALSPTNIWTDRTLLKLQTTQQTWTDPSTTATGRLFYRAVSVPVPADTNLVFIPPGTFIMGSPTSEALRFMEETQHVVTITRGFWMSQYLVQQKDYLAVVGSNPSQFLGDLTRPVDTVNWYNATNYCWLRTQQEQAAGLIPTNLVYRLATEAEWEYACRAGTTTAFYLGPSLSSGQARTLALLGPGELRRSIRL
jgi:formylglycine-generating enzyme required for sulfatase activity